MTDTRLSEPLAAQSGWVLTRQFEGMAPWCGECTVVGSRYVIHKQPHPMNRYTCRVWQPEEPSNA